MQAQKLLHPVKLLPRDDGQMMIPHPVQGQQGAIIFYRQMAQMIFGIEFLHDEFPGIFAVAQHLLQLAGAPGTAPWGGDAAPL